MNHKELTKHLRGRLAHAGIPCRVRMEDFNGSSAVSVITTSYEARWTSEQLREMALIAQCNRLTMSRGMPIDLDNMAQMTGTTQVNFFLAAAV
jgi:hypothetical protein